MSATPFELFERFRESWNAGDADGVVACCHPDIRLNLFRSELEGAYQGHDGIRQALADAAESWRELRFDPPEELRDLGERAFGATRIRATARDAALPLDVPLFVAWRLRNGLILEHRPVRDRQAAMTAAGIPEGSAIEVVRAIYATEWREGETRDLVHADFEGRWPRGLPSTESFRGPEGLVETARRWQEAWREFRMEPRELLERPGEVFAVLHYEALGRESGMELEADTAHIWSIREGRAAEMRMFSDAPKARARWIRGDSPYA